MKYFYIHPLKPQYFFPKDFEKHNLFFSFYRPYSILGKFSWFLFRSFPLYRYYFTKTNIEDFIPENKIREILGETAMIAFNRGTVGVEQKVTGLALDNNNCFFFKFAKTEISIRNTKNEYNILTQISDLDFVPKIKSFHNGDDHFLLKTNVLEGIPLVNIDLNFKILDCLFQIAKVPVNINKKLDKSLKYVFAHGDFCPWNIFDSEGKILVYDWEMGGNYVLGYDLFTFLFHSKFLLNPLKSVDTIMSENIKIIDKYFFHFKITSWKNYLLAFAKKRLDLQILKGETSMLSQYNNLIYFAEKL